MSDSDDYFAGLFVIGFFCFFLFFYGLVFTLPGRVGTLEEVNPIFHDLYEQEGSYHRYYIQVDRCAILSVTMVTILFIIVSFIRHRLKPTEGDGKKFLGYGIFLVFLGSLFIYCGGLSFGIVSLIGGFLLSSWSMYRYKISESALPKLNDTDTLDIYMPIDTLKQLDNVTPIYNIEEIGKYAECPYCGSNIRDSFYEFGGIVKCDKCGAFHHKECFEYYGRKCGSSSCKLRNA